MLGTAPVHERRSFPRARVRAQVENFSLDRSHGDAPLLGITRDLGAGGLAMHIPSFFVTETLLPPAGSHVLVRFRLPDVSNAFQIPSKVVWTGSSLPTSMGVEFLSLSDEDRSLIAGFVEQSVNRA